MQSQPASPPSARNGFVQMLCYVAFGGKCLFERGNGDSLFLSLLSLSCSWLTPESRDIVFDGWEIQLIYTWEFLDFKDLHIRS